ncbi:MAG: divalent-cation tolerance protein CutA [Bdellovibrionales bacterium]|nr:divalent-cation tolerance protein CutA [Bdellovibrionales bacterium]
MSGGATVYSTWPGREGAEAAAEIVVKEGLAACANLLGPATSIYRWKGELHRDAETVALFKTDQARAAALVGRLKELHPHDCPCLVAWNWSAGFAPYLDWVAAQTAPPPPT